MILMGFRHWLGALALICAGAIYTHAASAGTVLVSSHPLALIAAEITPPQLTVLSIADKNHSLHHQGLKPSQLRRINDADLVLWMGFEAEPGFAKGVSRVNQAKVKSLQDLPDIRPPLAAKPVRPSLEYTDVHLWLNPHNAVSLATKMAEELALKWPAYKNDVSANLLKFSIDIAAISSENHKKYKKRDFLALHDAYGHLAQFYGLNTVASIIGADGEKPGAMHLWDIEDQLKSRSSVCVLVQPQFSQRYLASIAKVVKVVIEEVDPGASDYDLSKGEFIRYSRDISLALSRCLNEEGGNEAG